MRRVNYSWIIPINNEEQSLPQLLREITLAMKSNNRYEIIAVDDGSTDKSLTTLKSLNEPTFRLKIIHLSRRQGKWETLRKGIEAAQGEVIIVSDSDLQDDPLEVKKLLNTFHQNNLDLISGRRIKRKDTLYKSILSGLGNKLVSILSNHHFYDLNSPFKIYKREVLEKLPKEGSLLRFSLLFAYKMGYKVKEVPLMHRKRLYGKSKFGIIKYFRILYDLVLVLLLFSGSGKLAKQ